MTSILLLNPTVVTMESENSVIRKGYIYVNDGKIISLGSAEKVPEEYRYADLILNLKGRTVIPGFISFHNHLALYPIRFLGENMYLSEWIETVAWPYEKTLTPEESYYAAKLAIYGLLKKGVIAVADMHFNMDAVARAIKETGIMANLSVAIMDTPIKTYESTLKENLNLYKKWHGLDNRITVSLGPCGIRFLKYEHLQEIAAIAKEENMSIHMHVSEVMDDVKYSKEKYGKRPVEVLQDLGLLSKETLLAHAIWISEKELVIMSKYNVVVALCPISNTLLFSGIPPIVDMLDKNMKLGFGIDISPEHDLLGEARTLYYMVNNIYGYPQRVKPYKLLKIITGGSAKLPGLEKHGILKPGYDANIVVLDSRDPVGWPSEEIYKSILFSKANVETVIVKGEVLVDGGEVLTIGTKEIEKAKEIVSKKINHLYS